MSDNGMLFILNQGWSIGFVVLGIVIIRAVLKKMTRRVYSYLLWLAVPVCYFYMVGEACFDVFYYKVIVKTSNEPFVCFWEKESMLLKMTWLIGFFGMIFYMVYSYVKTKHFTKQSRCLGENIYVTENYDMPFTAGVIKPRIFLPTKLEEEFYEPVICHENVHIARKDYFIKNLVFVLLAINWFQPLMWLGYFLFVKDMEVTCDERALKQRPMEFRKRYARALLELSTHEVRVGAVATGYGNVALKERIKNIGKNQKECRRQRVLITVMCVTLIVLSVPAYWYIRNPFGYKANAEVSTNEVWEVRTRIHP